MRALLDRAMTALPLVAILRGVTPDEIEAIGDALVAAGFGLIEVPLTSPDPFRSIERLATRLGPDVIVGAGTVRRTEQLDALLDAGGRLMVTPHADTNLIRAAVGRELIALPGVATPTEAFAALDAGAHGLKLFPSDVLPPSSVRAFRTVVGPGTYLCPTGGVRPGDLADYVRAGANGFGIGGALYRPGDSAAQVAERALAFATSWRSSIGDQKGNDDGR